jgi:zinc transport system substrate-binding protein
MLRIATDHGMRSIRESVLAIAGELDTHAAARENLRAIEAFFEAWRRELASAGLAGAAVIAHAMHRPLLEELGFRAAGTYGPGPLEAAKIRELSGLDVRMLADNVHNPLGGPLKETIKELRYLVLRNFPTAEMTLLELLAENRRLMAAAWKP